MQPWVSSWPLVGEILGVESLADEPALHVHHGGDDRVDRAGGDLPLRSPSVSIPLAIVASPWLDRGRGASDAGSRSAHCVLPALRRR